MTLVIKLMIIIGFKFLAGTGAHPASCYLVAGGLSLPGCEADPQLHLVRRLRMRVALPPFPHTPTWRDAQGKIRYLYKKHGESIIADHVDELLVYQVCCIMFWK
jgi:hypothetical protein